MIDCRAFLWPLLGYVDCRPLWGILPALYDSVDIIVPCCIIALVAASLCHIVRILHLWCALLMRLSRAICAHLCRLISNNSFAFELFGLKFYEGNNKACQKSLDFRVFGGISFRHLAGVLGIWGDEDCTHPPIYQSGQGRGCHSKFAPYFQKKVTLSLSASSLIYVHHFSYSKPFVSWLCVRKKIPEKKIRR